MTVWFVAGDMSVSDEWGVPQDSCLLILHHSFIIIIFIIIIIIIIVIIYYLYIKSISMHNIFIRACQFICFDRVFGHDGIIIRVVTTLHPHLCNYVLEVLKSFQNTRLQLTSVGHALWMQVQKWNARGHSVGLHMFRKWMMTSLSSLGVLERQQPCVALQMLNCSTL